jgi:hypothetical protein
MKNTLIGKRVFIRRGEWAGWYGTIDSIDSRGYLTVLVGGYLTSNLHPSEVDVVRI